MRIAVVYLGRRGAGGKIALELARHLSEMHTISAILSHHAENLEQWRKTSIELFEFTTYRNAPEAFASLIIPFKVQEVVEQIEKIQPDVLLFPMFHPWNALIQRRLSGVPSVIYVHDPSPHPDMAGWFYGKLENESIRLATRCVVMSEILKPALIQRGVDSEKIDMIPLGPLGDVSSIPLKKKTDNLPTLLFFGRIMPYKGLEVLLDAYERVCKITDCRLLIAGDGDLNAYREKLAELPNVEIVNRWIDGDEIENFFMQSDIVILPYTSASQSGVIPIAATFGLPVIATRTGGLPEQIENGLSGWLVSASDAAALADAIHDALIHPDEARRRGEMLKERYARLFNWEQNTRQVEQSLLKANQVRGQK